MDELTAVRELRADAPTPDAGRLAAGRRRLMSEITATGTRTAGRRLWRGNGAAGAGGVPERARRNGLVALTATAVVAVLLVAGVLMQGAGRPRPAGVAAPPATAAARLLSNAAATVAATPSKQPGPNQWLYTRAVFCQGTGTWCTTTDSWVRYRDGLRADVPDPAEDGTPPKKIEEDTARDEFGARPRIDRAWLASLPAEPHAALKQIDSKDLGWPFPAPASHKSPEYQFRRVLDILQVTQPTPPKYAAALYRALAVIPGVEIHTGLLKDAAGREGLGIGIRGGNGEYLVLDPVTYAYRGLNWDLRGSEPLLRTYALRSAGVVDHVGQVPGGPIPPASSIVPPRKAPDPKVPKRNATKGPVSSSPPSVLHNFAG
ncbi:CU044_5270 family protein [Streptomyces sp. NBC_01198]|uniref:CU044_5270 family protein n=1 Tax=Streptomyces sp. NBC_01198 TaxID=2903769 RepID=UPI002E13ED70|nr:CU044_5270 family protein [Streptomyces sp. NBC_01198]